MENEMTNDAAVACHRVRSAGYAGYGVWRDGDIPIDEAQYWESADSSFYIERAYSATTVAELRARVADLTADRDSWLDQASERVRNWHEEHEARKAAERRVEEAESVCRAVLGTFQRNLASEEACGQPFMGDDEHEAIRLLTKFLTKESK